MVSDNKLQMGHVRPLITLNDDKEIIEAAKKAVNLGLSVRAVEKMVKKPEDKEPKKEVSTDFSYARKLLESKVQSKVSIDDSKITIAYHGIADLNRILEALDVLEKED
jgi:ParB family chromosome partitioning protein